MDLGFGINTERAGFNRNRHVLQILLAMIRVSKKELKTLLDHDDIEISQSQIDTSWVEILYAKEQRLKQLRRRRYSGIAAAILVFLGVGSFWTLKQETPQLTPIELYALESRGADDAAAAGHISLSTNRDNVIEVESDNANFDYSIRGAIVIDVDTMQIVDEPVRAYNTLKVPAGKRASLSLSDGSRIILNSRSRLVYPIAINSGKREVYLEGEAYFDIAKDVNNPFSVHTDRCVVKVMGTEFNVKAYQSNATHDVVLVRGKVAVKAGNAASDLRPGQMVSASTDKLTEVSEVNTSLYTSWIDNMLIYDNTPISEIFGRLQEIYGVAFDLNSNAENLHVSGKLNLNGSLNEILNTISFSIPIEYQHGDDKITVSRANN